MNQNFEPREVRDFGEIINDSFSFVFQTWKPLLKAYISICGFFVVGGLIANVLYQFRIMKSIKEGASIGARPLEIYSNMWGFEFLFTLIFSLLTYTSISLLALSFIHLYKEKGNETPSTEEVWTYVKFYFPRFILGAVLLGILTVIGAMLCIIPGIYLWPILFLVFPIMLMENASLGYSFSAAFSLIKNNWWPTFGVQVIMGFIVMAAAFFFVLPLTIIGMGSFFTGAGKMSAIAVIVQVTISQACLVFMILPNIAIALSYYSLTEQKKGVGLMQRINSLGKTGTPSESTPEEY